MAGKTRAEMNLETLIEFAAVNRDNWLKIDETMQQLIGTVDTLGQKVDKLTDRIDTLSQVTNANQVIVASLVSLAEKQQATVDKLLTVKTG
ncbi:MAG TPA: hypothetical protein V6D34_04980 [Candidatus Sericytochromatia bacterium]|jgi:hypothetical protein